MVVPESIMCPRRFDIAPQGCALARKDVAFATALGASVPLAGHFLCCRKRYGL